MILDGRFSVFPYYVTLFLNICSILRESDIIHKKIRNYLEGKITSIRPERFKLAGQLTVVSIWMLYVNRKAFHRRILCQVWNARCYNELITANNYTLD